MQEVASYVYIQNIYDHIDRCLKKNRKKIVKINILSMNLVNFFYQPLVAN